MKALVAIFAVILHQSAIAEDLYVCKFGDKRVVKNVPCSSNEKTTSTVTTESAAVAAARERQGAETQRRLLELSNANSREAIRYEREETARQEAYRRAQQQELAEQQRQQQALREERFRQQQAAELAEAKEAAKRAEAAANAAANAAATRSPTNCYQKMNGAIFCN